MSAGSGGVLEVDDELEELDDLPLDMDESMSSRAELSAVASVDETVPEETSFDSSSFRRSSGDV
jgi:hypothetical protein